MRIGIDAMLLWGEWTGIGRSILETARRLSSDGRGHEYVFYASRGFRGKRGLASPHFSVRRTWFHARNRTLRILWQQLRLPFRAVRDRVDVLHAPAYVMPLLSYVPVVVTVHDTIAFARPDLVRRSNRAHLKRFLPKTLERAELVLVPSHTVADDLEDVFGSLEREKAAGRERGALGEKIRVVPFGVGPEFRPLEGDARTAARTALGIERPYVLFVSRVEPKKNLSTVLQTYFAAVMARDLPHELVLAGPGVNSRRVTKLVRHLGIEDRTHRLGYVAEEKLPDLYAAADCLLFPSLIEGFGFPVLEAMACGVPCVISEDPALKELAAGAAVMVAPKRLDLLRLALERVLTEPKHASELRARGIERAGLFAWERTVDLTVAAYEEARERYEKSRPG